MPPRTPTTATSTEMASKAHFLRDPVENSSISSPVGRDHCFKHWILKVMANSVHGGIWRYWTILHHRLNYNRSNISCRRRTSHPITTSRKKRRPRTTKTIPALLSFKREDQRQWSHSEKTDTFRDKLMVDRDWWAFTREASALIGILILDCDFHFPACFGYLTSPVLRSIRSGFLFQIKILHFCGPGSCTNQHHPLLPTKTDISRRMAHPFILGAGTWKPPTRHLGLYFLCSIQALMELGGS